MSTSEFGLEVYDSNQRSVLPNFAVIGAVTASKGKESQTLIFNDLAMCEAVYYGRMVFKFVEISTSNSNMVERPIASSCVSTVIGINPAYDKVVEDARIMAVATHTVFTNTVLEVREAIRVMVADNAANNILAMDANGEPNGIYEVSDGGIISTTVTNLTKTNLWESDEERDSYQLRVNNFYAYLSNSQGNLNLQRSVFLDSYNKYNDMEKYKIPPHMQIIVYSGNLESRVILLLTSKV